MSEKKTSFPNTDGREEGKYETRYNDKKIRCQQWKEAIYLLVLYVASISILILNFKECFVIWFEIDSGKSELFVKVITCSICGLFGGTINDIKWFYHTIARGYWNQDRVFWRIFTPFVSLGFAFALSCILHKSMLANGNHFTAATLGFLSGYFSDKAAGKMSEVATVLFNTKSKESETNKNDD